MVRDKGRDSALEHYKMVDLSKLHYHDLPRYFTLGSNKKERTAWWRRRTQGCSRVKTRLSRQHPRQPGETGSAHKERLQQLPDWIATDDVGRLRISNPKQSEEFSLRRLLVNIPGSTSFTDLLTVNGRECESFQESCIERGFSNAEVEYRECLREASVSYTASQLRSLFVTILIHCGYSTPSKLYSEFQEDMAADFLRQEEREDSEGSSEGGGNASPGGSDNSELAEIQTDLEWRSRIRAQQSTGATTTVTRSDSDDSGGESLSDNDLLSGASKGSDSPRSSDLEFLDDSSSNDSGSGRPRGSDPFADSSSADSPGESGSERGSGFIDRDRATIGSVVPEWKQRAYIQL